MISAKRLVELAKKWQKVAAMRRYKIKSPSRSNSRIVRKSGGSDVHKGHVVLYTLEGSRFMVPLGYLNSPVFKELFKLSEDEFGLQVNGPITLPCSGVFMEYAISAVRRKVPKSVEKDLIISIASGRCSPAIFFHDHKGLVDQQQQLLLHGF